MTFMMTLSNDGKSDVCQFFYQDSFHIVNTKFVNTIVNTIVQDSM